MLGYELNVLFAKADNEQEYIHLIKKLFTQTKLYGHLCGEIYSNKMHLFDDDLESWHETFETDCYYDYDNHDELLINVDDYNGDYAIKPLQEEYPVILVWNINDQEIMWQSLKLLD